MSFRPKCPDLHWCLAKPTDLWCFVVSQPMIKFTHFHGQFLFKNLPLVDKKYFVEPCPQVLASLICQTVGGLLGAGLIDRQGRKPVLQVPHPHRLDTKWIWREKKCNFIEAAFSFSFVYDPYIWIIKKRKKIQLQWNCIFSLCRSSSIYHWIYRAFMFELEKKPAPHALFYAYGLFRSIKVY